MNKILSLLFCLILTLPAHGMDIHLVEDQAPAASTPRKLVDKIWQNVSCKKIFIAGLCIATLGILSTGGYFITSTCLKMQDGCDTIKAGCTEMKSACTNCTTNFAQANCGLKLIDSVATLIEQIVKKYPQVALDLALELGYLNKSLNCS